MYSALHPKDEQTATQASLQYCLGGLNQKMFASCVTCEWMKIRWWVEYVMLHDLVSDIAIDTRINE